MNKGKLINGELVYASNFMFIESEGNWVTNPTDEQLKKEGYKELVYKEVEEVINNFEETEVEIVKYIKINIENGEEN